MAKSIRLGSRLKKPEVVTVSVALIIIGAMFLAAVLIPWERREKLNTAPVADAGNNIIGYVDASIEFDTLSYDPDIDGKIENYTWDFGDGSFSYERSPTHIYRALGNYTITLTVADNDGAEASDSITVKIVELVTQDLNELLTNSQIYKDTIVTVVNATVTDAGSYTLGYGENPNGWVNFKISDNSTTQALTVYCESGATRPLALAKYDIVNVQGIFFWYATGNYWELKVRKATEDNVELVEGGGISTPAYTNSTIRELLQNPESYEGASVRVTNATVSGYYYSSDYGYTKFDIQDNSTAQTLAVYCESGASIPSEFGDGYIVHVQGLFTYYTDGGYWEIMISEGTDDHVELGPPPEYITVTISTLLYNPTEYENTNVSIETAIVSSGYKTVENGVTLVVHDQSTTTTITVLIENNATKPLSANKDDIVNVQGLFRWNNITGCWEIWVRNSTTYPDTHDSVKIPTPLEYAFVTIDALVYNPTNYKDTEVKVENLSVSECYYSSTGWTKFTITGLNVSSSLVVYCEKNSNISSGLKNKDTANVQGLFTWYYKGYWEIMVRNKETALTADDKVERTGRLPPEYVNISAVQADVDGDGASDMAGETIAVRGTVTGIFSSGFYVQDNTEGIIVYAPGYNVTFGDYVDVEGTVTEYYNETELTDIVNITIKGPGIVPKPVIMNTANAMNETNEGRIMKITGTVSSKDTYGFYINDGSGAAYVYVYSWIDFSGINTGDNVTILGLGSQYKEKHEIKPRYQSDIANGTMVDILPIVPVIRISPEIPTYLENVSITARAADDYSIASVVLNYTADNWITYNNVNMSSNGTVEYRAEIPAQPNWTTIKYNIIATDNSTQKTITAENSYIINASLWTDHVVISEVLFNPAGSDAGMEWIELYNPTATEINISSWIVEHWVGDDNAFHGTVTLPSDAIIHPYGFYLVGWSSAIAPTPDYVPAEWFYPPVGLHNGGGNGAAIILKNESEIVVDILGYGNIPAEYPAFYEGSPVPISGVDNRSLERKPGFNDPEHGNGWDTNNNENDFVESSSPYPQNSSYIEIPESARGNKNKGSSGRFSIIVINNQMQNYLTAKFN